MENNIIEIIKSLSIDVKKFEENNDMNKDELFHSDSRSGTFTVSDGTEYAYSLHFGLTINKKSEFVKVGD